MFYPNHHIRTYCLYLGSITLNDTNFDLGVYEQKDGSVSHAIVYGEDPSEYISGEFIFRGEPCADWKSLRARVNKIAYDAYLMGKKEGGNLNEIQKEFPKDVF